MVIRAALLADAQELALLGARLWRETYTGQIPASDLDSYLGEAFGLDQQAAELADPAGQTLVVDEDGRLHGYAWLRTSGPGVDDASRLFARPLEVARFYVERALHGTGAAQSLMAAVFAHAAAGDHDGVWLQVWEQNPRALRFYAKAGFADAGTTAFRVGEQVYRDRLLAAPVRIGLAGR